MCSMETTPVGGDKLLNATKQVGGGGGGGRRETAEDSVGERTERAAINADVIASVFAQTNATKEIALTSRLRQQHLHAVETVNRSE